MTANENLSKLFLKSIVVLVKLSEELENSYLEEGILDSSDLILALELQSNLPIGSLYFGEQLYNLWDVRLIDADGVLEEGSASQQYSVALFFEASGYLW